MDWLSPGSAQRVVGAVLIIFLFRRRTIAQSSSQWETRVDYLKKYLQPFWPIRSNRKKYGNRYVTSEQFKNQAHINLGSFFVSHSDYYRLTGLPCFCSADSGTRTTLTSVRYAATVGSNIFVYFMTWTFLGFGSTDTSIGGDNTEDFRSLDLCRFTTLKGQCHEFFCFRFFHESSSRQRWCTLSCEYLREFSKKFKTDLIVHSGVWGKLIHKKTWSRKSRGTVPLLCIPGKRRWQETDTGNLVWCTGTSCWWVLVWV